jgi:Ca-activated chloride channel homolog
MLFLNPTQLLLLVLIPFAVVFFVWRERVRFAKWLLLGDVGLLSRLIPQTSRSRRFWKSALWIITLLSLIVASARPVWGEEVSIIETQGTSVMVALDVSKSMNAQDIMPSRLERAKLAINDLMDGLVGNEVGLILFAGSAFVQFPLTVDTASASTFLEAASSDSISHQGTDLDAALHLAMDSFRNPTGSQRTIILITDGENHEGNPLDAAAFAAEQGIVIHTIGYGSVDGATIPVRDSNGNEIGFQTDRDGNLVLSKLDEAILQQIAERTGGIYQHATGNSAEMTNLNNLIQQSEAEDLGTRTETRRIERFGIFVALALVALSLEMLLPDAQRES